MRFSDWLIPSNQLKNFTYTIDKDGKISKFNNEMEAYEYTNQNQCRILEEYEIPYIDKVMMDNFLIK